MAKNILSSNYTNQEVLHTKSAFLTHKKFNFSFRNSTLTLDQSIIQAEAREREFYNKFGVNNYVDFMTLVRTDFIKSEGDRQVLSNFSYDGLNATLYSAFRNLSRNYHNAEDYEVTINIKDTATPEIQKTVQKMFKEVFGKDAEFTGNFKISIDSPLLFKLINKSQKSSKSTTVMSSHKASAGRIKDVETLETEMAKDNSWLQINIVDSASRQTNYSLSEIMKADEQEYRFPWGYKKDDIIRAESDPKLRERIQEAYEQVKNYVINTLGAGASPNLKRALQITWVKKMGTQLTQDFSFFEKGRASNSLKGAMGEFQTAAMMELFYLQYAGNTGKTVAKIMGDTDSTGGLADVSVFDDFGIQVKNFTEMATKKREDVGATISIGNITKYFSNEDSAKDTRIFFANYFFNKTYQEKMKNLYDNLSMQLAQMHYILLSLSVASEDNKVSFYLISGKYLVPASEILKSIQDDSSNFQSNGKPVYTKQIGATDEEYADNLYKKYWQANNSDGRVYYTPTTENENLYNSLVYTNIHVKSSFNYKRILSDVSKSYYALY